MEKEKVEQIFIEYRDRLFGFIYGMIKDRDRTHDIIQETFLRLYREEKEIYNVKGWLFRVARNLMIDYIRKNRKILTIQDEMDLGDGGENERINKLRALLEKEIEKLPDLYKKIFVLRDVEGYSYEEISKKTGLPLGTVKTRIFRARTFLRERLKDELRKI